MRNSKPRKAVGKAEELYPSCRSRWLVHAKAATPLRRARASEFGSLREPAEYGTRKTGQECAQRSSQR